MRVHNVFNALLIAAALLFGGAAQSEELAGVTLLVPPQPVSTRKIEVLEFFSYQCPHCYHLHGPLSAWMKTMPKDVELVFVPVPNFQPSWGPAAHAYYALEGMGKIRELDDAIYDAIDKRTADLYDMESYANFVASHGVDRAAFLAALNPRTFSGSVVAQKVKTAEQMTLRYGIAGTPTLVVDGKFLVRAQYNPADTLRALDSAIAQARKERGSTR